MPGGASRGHVMARFYPRGVLRAVVFDVDFTLARPGPDLGPDGYRALGLRYGLDLDPSRYEEARAAAFSEVKRHPELDHDEEIWVLFTERIILGMGGRGDTYAAAVEMERRWAHSAHFELYDDALPALGGDARAWAEDRAALELVAEPGRVRRAPRARRPTPCSPRDAHGKTKPHESIFLALLGAARRGSRPRR